MDRRRTEEELAEIEKVEREVLPVLRALAEKFLGPDWREKTERERFRSSVTGNDCWTRVDSPTRELAKAKPMDA